MECVKCHKKAGIKIQNLEVCDFCFVKIIEKRIRKEIRQKRLLKNTDSILIIDDSSAEAKVSIFFLKTLMRGIYPKITVKKMNSIPVIGGKFTKIIIPWNAEKEASLFLEQVFQNKISDFIGHYSIKGKTYVKLLLPLSKREIMEYAKIKKVKYKAEKKEEFIPSLFLKLEKDYPEIVFSLVKSSKEVNCK